MEFGFLSGKESKSGYVSPWGEPQSKAFFENLKVEMRFYPFSEIGVGSPEDRKLEIIKEIYNMPQMRHSNVHVLSASLYVLSITESDNPFIDDGTISKLRERLNTHGRPQNQLDVTELNVALKSNIIRYIIGIKSWKNYSGFIPASDEVMEDQQEEVDEGELNEYDDSVDLGLEDF